MKGRMGRRDFLRLTGTVTASSILAACGVTPTPTTTAPAGTSATGKPYSGITINGIMESKPLPEGGMKDILVPQWADKTGGQVNLSLLDYDSLAQKAVLDATAKGGGYDFYGMDLIWTGQFAVGEFVTPLNDRLSGDADLAGIDPALISGVSWDGKVIGLPITNQCVNLWYRSDLFSKEGIEPPTNWDDFVRLAAQFVGDWANDGKPHYGVAMGVKRGVFIVHDWMAYFAAMGGQVFDNWPDISRTTWHPQVNSDAGVKALELYQEMAKYAPPGIMDYDWEKAQTALTDGTVAMLVTWNNGITPRIFKPDCPVLDKIGWARIPNAPGLAKPFDARGFWSMTINANSRYPDAVWDFAKFVLSKSAQEQLAKQDPALVPVRSDLLTEMAATSGASSFLPFMAELSKNDNPLNFDWRPRIPEWANIQEIFGLLLNEAMIGNKTAKEALDEGNARLTQAMQDAGYF